MTEEDPLLVVRNGKPANVDGLWGPNPAFLVGGGPSLNDHNLDRLRERGVMSFGINQAAAWPPIRGWVASDTHWKFHHGLYLDPGVMSFVPEPKLKWTFTVKQGKNTFRKTTIKVRDCPNTYGYSRRTRFVPREFFTTPYAHWGPSKDQPKGESSIGTLCTMLIGLRLLHHLGAGKVFLVGVDFRMGVSDDEHYAFPQRRNVGEVRANNGNFSVVNGWLCKMEREGVFNRAGLEVYNCNRESGLRAFLHVPFDVAVREARSGIPEGVFDLEGWY